MRRMTANMVAFRADPENPAAHHRGVRPPRRDRHRRARACRHAAQHRDDAAAEEPSRRARARGVEDQPRSAQPPLLGAAVLRAPGEDFPIRTCSASRPSSCARSSAPSPSASRPCPTAACRSRRPTAVPDRARASGRGRARDARPRLAARRCVGSARSSAASPSTPTPTSCSASCSILCATRCRRSRAATPATPRAIRSASPAGARARWR